MPSPVIMPKFEMSQETAQLIEWHKKEGDEINKGETLLSVETDKVTMEIESPASGILAGVTAQPGDVVPVTSVIAYILKPGEELPVSVPKPEETVSSIDRPSLEPPPQEISAEEKRVTPLAQRMASASGLDISNLKGSGRGGQILRSDVEAALSGENKPKNMTGEEQESGKLRASPAARRIARELNIDLRFVKGSGKRNRIQGEDIIAADRRETEEKEVIPAEDQYDTIQLQGVRRTIAEKMQHSFQTAPHITFTTRVDTTAFSQVRSELNTHSDSQGGPRISVTALLVKLVGAALVRRRELNSVLMGEEIHRYSTAHVGVAVALPEGLIVPVIREAEVKPVSTIASELSELTERARKGQLVPSEVSGGTFTISNLGPFGIEQFTAILNPGQAGILAIGSTIQEPLVVDGQLEIRPVMHMTLSADHRIVDGAQAAHFLAELRRFIENPTLLLW
jgi:pyruvate dehydrogenase E2 component (dihydrolipoamide acetyltransferase)